MKIIFDLDYTLLDTGSFKKALTRAFISCGIIHERYEETYHATMRRDGKISDYDPNAHADALTADFPSSEAKIRACEQVNELLKNTEEYLFPGAIELLQALRRDGNELVLLTLGNETWQRAKIEHSGLSDLFDEVITTGEHKHNLLRSIVPENGTAIIVNDNGNEMKELMQEMPGCTYVLMKGPKSMVEGLELPEIASIKELGQYFERMEIVKEPYAKVGMPPGSGR